MKSKAFSLLIIILMLFSGIILSSRNVNSQKEPEIIYIDLDGYYTLGPFDPWSFTDIWINISVDDGEKVDVYVMSYTQFDNAYPWEETEPKAVSFMASSEENVSTASIHHRFDTNYNDMYEVSEEGVFIVIDNRQCNITPNDANPTGPVKVEMTREFAEGDAFGGFDGFMWPFMLISIIEVLVFVGAIVLIIMLVLHFDKKKKEQALQPPPPYPYYPGQPLQYQQPAYPPQQPHPAQQPSQSLPVQPIEPIAQPPSEGQAQPPTRDPPKKSDE